MTYPNTDDVAGQDEALLLQAEELKLKEEELKIREEDVKVKEEQVSLAKRQLSVQSWHVIALFIGLFVALANILMNSINMFLLLRK